MLRLRDRHELSRDVTQKSLSQRWTRDAPSNRRASLEQYQNADRLKGRNTREVLLYRWLRYAGELAASEVDTYERTRIELDRHPMTKVSDLRSETQERKSSAGLISPCRDVTQAP